MFMFVSIFRYAIILHGQYLSEKIFLKKKSENSPLNI